MTTKTKSRIPDFKNRQEIATWFDTHDLGDYQDEFKTVKAKFSKNLGYTPEQIQDFIPLPMTRSGCMYYTATDPDSGKALYVAKKKSERMSQRRLVQGRHNE